MAGTKNEQEKIKIADMLGLSREWIAVLRDGPEEFRKSAAAATEAGAVLDKEILNKAKQFDREWNASLVKFKAGFVSALTDIAGSFQGLFGVISKLGELGTTALSKLAKGGLGEIGANLLKTGKGTALSTDVDSLYGGLLPSAASSGAGSAGKSTVIPREKQDDPFRSALFDAQKRIAQVEAETRAIGLNSEARERAKLMADLESAAKKANSDAGFQNATITEAQRKKIEELGAAMEAAARKQRMSHEALQQFAVDSMDSIAQFDSLAISAFGNLENSMVSFIDGSKNAKEAFADMTKSILSDLTRMMIRMSVTGPLAKALSGLLTGGPGRRGRSGGGALRLWAGRPASARTGPRGGLHRRTTLSFGHRAE